MSRVIKSSQVNFLKTEQVYKLSMDDKSTDKEVQEERKVDTQQEYEDIMNIAKKQAKDLVDDAVKEAADIKENVLKNAEDELEVIKREAYEEGHELGKSEGSSVGYEEGYKKGFDEGREESEVLIEEAEDIKKECIEEKEKTLSSIESEVIKLVLSITEKVLNQKISEDDQTIVNLVLKGLESLNSKENIRIRVSSEDYEKVSESKEQILSKVSLIEDLKVDVDSNLKSGDCIIESSKGDVDVSVDTQIKNIEEGLNNLLDSE